MEYYYNFADRLLLLLIALYLSLILGYFMTLRTIFFLDFPLKLWQSFLNMIGHKLNRTQRSNNDKRLRGRLVLSFFSAFMIALGVLLSVCTSTTAHGYILEIIFLIFLIPISSCIIPVRQAQIALKEKNMKKVIEAIQPITQIDLYEADGFQMIRFSITHLATSLGCFVISPIFWYLMLGMPAILTVVLIAALCDLYPTNIARNRAFATSFHFWNNILQAIPARIALFVMGFGMVFVPKASVSEAINGLQENKDKLNNRNITTYFAAYGLRICLGGNYVIDGYKVETPWIGRGKARVDLSDLSRAMWWYWCNIAILLLTISALFLSIVK
jgi:adenosylcobinamide-phosphate synthase